MKRNIYKQRKTAKMNEKVEKSRHFITGGKQHKGNL